jgi:hypothetical protein
MADKYLTNSAGVTTQKEAKQTSAGAGDAGKIPALNASGVLDSTIVNSTIVSAGAGDSGKLTRLDAAGKLDSTVMPSGVGPDTASITASENITAPAVVNVWNDAGAFKVRKADASAPGKEAHGFILVNATTGNPVAVYFGGSMTGLVGLTPANYFLSATTPGAITSTAPSTAGQVEQKLGVATSATILNFSAGEPKSIV